jgi:hypothetical protein
MLAVLLAFLNDVCCQHGRATIRQTSPTDPPALKKTSTHIRGDSVLEPTCMAIHVLAYTHADRLRRGKICCVQLLRAQLSSRLPQWVCYEHEYDGATPTSDLRNALG